MIHLVVSGLESLALLIKFNLHLFQRSKKKRCIIYGKWTECMYTIDPKVYEANKKAEKKSGDSKKHKQVRIIVCEN